jgi:hypothetical protein
MSFGSWLRTQTNRRDEVGCLARQVYDDKCMPHAASYPDAVKHIQMVHCDGSIDNPILLTHIGAAADEYTHYCQSPVR